LQAKDGACNPKRRICLNHPNAQLEEALRRAFFRVEYGGLRHAHFPRRLRAALPGFFPEAFGKGGQFPFNQQFGFWHGEILENIFILATLFSCTAPAFLI
jgi:hypothetical protein